MNLLSRVAWALREPNEVFPYLKQRVKRAQVRRVVIDGETYRRYKGDLYPDYLFTGNAAEWIREEALQHCQGHGLDIGSGPWPLPGATSIEDHADENAYSLDRFADGSQDFVFSSHCLEHLERWEEALDLWIRKLRPGGVLFLYLPHESNKTWHPGGPMVGENHKWMPTHEALVPFVTARGIRIDDVNKDRDKYWSWHLRGTLASAP